MDKPIPEKDWKSTKRLIEIGLYQRLSTIKADEAHTEESRKNLLKVAAESLGESLGKTSATWGGVPKELRLIIKSAGGLGIGDPLTAGSETIGAALYVFATGKRKDYVTYLTRATEELINRTRVAEEREVRLFNLCRDVLAARKNKDAIKLLEERWERLDY